MKDILINYSLFTLAPLLFFISRVAIDSINHQPVEKILSTNSSRIGKMFAKSFLLSALCYIPLIIPFVTLEKDSNEQWLSDYMWGYFTVFIITVIIYSLITWMHWYFGVGYKFILITPDGEWHLSKRIDKDTILITDENRLPNSTLNELKFVDWSDFKDFKIQQHYIEPRNPNKLRFLNERVSKNPYPYLFGSLILLLVLLVIEIYYKTGLIVSLFILFFCMLFYIFGVYVSVIALNERVKKRLNKYLGN